MKFWLHMPNPSRNLKVLRRRRRNDENKRLLSVFCSLGVRMHRGLRICRGGSVRGSALASLFSPFARICLYRAMAKRRSNRRALPILLRLRAATLCSGHFAALKFPAMAQFVRSAEISTGGTGIPLGIVLLVLPAFFCALPYYYRTGVKKIPQKLILGGIVILNVAITLAYAFYFERLFYGAI